MGVIKKQSVNNAVISYIGAGLGFLIIYIQPQLISAGDIGLMRLMFSFSWMAAVIMPLGIGSVTMRFFPRFRDEQSRHNGLFLLIVLVTTIGFVIVGFLLWIFRQNLIRYYANSPDFSEYFIYCIGFAYVLALISVLSIYSASLYKTTFAVFLTDIFTRVGQLLVVVLYYFDVLDRDGLVFSYIGIFVVQLLLLVYYLRTHSALAFKVNWKFFKTQDLKTMTMFAFLMLFTAFASLGVKFIDQLSLGHFLSERMVGIYATGVYMCAVMEIPFNSLERIALPRIADAWSNSNSAEVAKIYEMSSRYMYFIGGILFCFLWWSLDLIFLYLPAEYNQAKLAVYVVSVSSLLNLVTGVNSSVLMASHKYFAASFFLFVLIAVAVLFNNLLIGPFGITGAAYATLIAIGCFNVLKYIYILVRFKMQPFSRHTVYISSCITISLVVLWLLPENRHPFLKAVFGCAFTAALFAYVNVKANSVEEANKFLKRVRLLK